MKKVLLLMMIPFYGITQDLVNRSDLYQIAEKDILSQFVIEHNGIDAKKALSAVKKWASTSIINYKENTVLEGNDFIEYKSVINFVYKGLMKVSTKAKITAHTKFEFKNNRTRVTITELPSLYISTSGYDSYIVWPHYKRKVEYLSGKGNWRLKYWDKGFDKSNYRRFKEAIKKRDALIKNIISIDFLSYSSGDDW